ncbi:dihydropyrimidinase [Pelagibius sp. CAU 1746]|uniref:dihydropyrimidinase n=1 Tax=Pelagibius sp. CAU 1746 TaxID=3140370 RepID=UPI00325AE540
MKEFDVVIRNGTVATAGDTMSCDIGIDGGKVAALGVSLPEGRSEIDATGLIVTPGGVDAHCHLDQPMGDGSEMADDFESGTLSAAFGGTTTVIPFACQMKGQTLRAAVTDYHERAKGKAYVDYAFHLIVSDVNESVLGQELPALIEDGYTSFKIYMTYDDLKLDDKDILDVLAVAKREGGMTMIHAENSDCIKWLTEQLVAAGCTSPKYHAASRPAPVEREATHRAVTLAEIVDVPALIVHVSGEEAIRQIREGQARGARILGETCPQYLFLTADDLDLDGFEGAKYICSPPPRDKSNQDAVWKALQSGVFQVFSSDHAPFRFDDRKGKKLKGDHACFNHVPNGIPGLETRMPLLFSEGVMKGRIDLQRFVQLTATEPARVYGLYPRKGTIAVGADADIVAWDPKREVTLTNGLLHHNVDYTPYAGKVLTGWPVLTMSRGEVVCRNGDLVAQKGRGAFLPCDRPEYVKANRVA